jgi:hypothetical protein
MNNNTEDARKYINRHYPDKNIKEINIEDKNLKGELDLTEFVQLKKLNCSNNHLIFLDLRDCSNLESLDAKDNKIERINLPSNKKKLRTIILSSNNLTDRDLRLFSEYINLEKLYIGSKYKEDTPDVYNHIDGSLKWLRRLTKLEYLNIENTDIDSGLEYLPDSIRYFYSLPSNKRPGTRVEEIFNELSRYSNNGNIGNNTNPQNLKNWYFELSEWKKNNFAYYLNKKEDDIENMLANIRAVQSGAAPEQIVVEEIGLLCKQIQDDIRAKDQTLNDLRGRLELMRLDDKRRVELQNKIQNLETNRNILQEQLNNLRYEVMEPLNKGERNINQAIQALDVDITDNDRLKDWSHKAVKLVKTRDKLKELKESFQILNDITRTQYLCTIANILEVPLDSNRDFESMKEEIKRLKIEELERQESRLSNDISSQVGNLTWSSILLSLEQPMENDNMIDNIVFTINNNLISRMVLNDDVRSTLLNNIRDLCRTKSFIFRTRNSQ